MVFLRRGGLPGPRSATPATYHRDVVPNRDPGAMTASAATDDAPTLTSAVPPRHDRDLAEAILDAVVEAIVVLDPATGRIVDVNRGAEVLFARDRDTMFGRSFADLVRPTDAARLAGFIDQIGAGRRNAATVMTEIQPASGPPLSLEVVLQPLATEGGPPAIIAIARDVTDRIEVQVRLQRLAQAEHARAAELNAVIRAMGEAVVVCAADGRTVLANPAAERLLPDIASQSYDDVLGLLNDPSRLAPKLGAREGPVELSVRADPDRWFELTTYPVTVGIGLAAADDETILVIRDEAERLQRLVEDVVAMNQLSDEDGEIGWEPVLV